MNVSAPVLQALVDAVVDGTEAAAGWLVAREGDRLRVVAASGDGVQDLVGASVGDGEGTAGFVVASNQPLALNAPGRGDARLSAGVNALAGRTPNAVLCVPCATVDAVVGALEVVDKLGGGTFTFPDIELATLLAAVGAAALVDGATTRSVSSPAELARDLARLAEVDPVRYAAVAGALDALLANG
jgi:GAF domain-containing protein